MKTLRVRSLALAALAALGLALAGCSKSDAPPPAEKKGPARVVLALDWVPEPEFGGFYAAREAGAFLKQGLEVEIRGGGAGVPVLQMVATDKVQFGIAGAGDILTAR